MLIKILTRSQSWDIWVFSFKLIDALFFPLFVIHERFLIWGKSLIVKTCLIASICFSKKNKQFQ